MSDATPEGAPADAPAEGPAPDGEAAAPDRPDAGGSGELDIATLPPQVQEYIRELRDEAKNRRLEHDPFKRAFEHFNQSEQEYLLNMVDQLGVNQDVGAQAMLDLSQRLLGIEQAGEVVAEDVQGQEEAEAAGLTEEQYREMVREEVNAAQERQHQEQLIAQVREETEAVGFDPDSQEAAMLWDLAVALDETDLSKVAPIVRQRLGLPEPEGQAEVAEAPAEPEPELTEYPRSAAATGGGLGANAEERTPPPKLGSDELRERVRRRIMAEAGQ